MDQDAILRHVIDDEFHTTTAYQVNPSGQTTAVAFSKCRGQRQSYNGWRAFTKAELIRMMAARINNLISVYTKAVTQMKRMSFSKPGFALALSIAIVAAGSSRQAGASQQADVQIPSTPLKFGVFAARFDSVGAFKLEGAGWPSLGGDWKLKGDEIELVTSNAPKSCEGPGRYRVRVEGKHVTFDLVADDCVPRRMILNNSIWSPAEEAKVIPPRRIAITSNTKGARPPKRPEPNATKGNWPTFRGTQAEGVADRQNLPDRWDGKTGENILWRTTIPGLAHSSPVVWGQDRKSVV